MKKKASAKLQELSVAVAAEGGSSMHVNHNIRRNAAGTIERTDRFKNIDDGLVPFRNSSTIYGANQSSVDVRDAVVLCQKCYYNFALFRNIIDLMTEFSVSDVYLEGGSKKSQDFFYALFNKINLWDFQDKFFREYYRSGNVFVYRFDAQLQSNDVQKIIQTFGATKVVGGDPLIPPINDQNIQKANPYGPKGNSPDNQYLNPTYTINPDKVEEFKMKIPARYIILNPADIQMMSTLNFAWGMYFKILTDYEVARLRTPKTQEDVEVFKTLPKVAQDAIKLGTRVIAVPLDPHKVSMVFYKKQDYEPFAVPMGFPVLEDINAKAEMKKIDMAIARTMQQIVLLVTTGSELKNGDLNINPKNIEALKKIFANQSVGRVLVADFTTEAKFVIPEIGELLNPQKYEVFDRDINIGLNNVFAGTEKFANQAQKVELFIARLAQGRKAFLCNFLQPEIKRIADSIGLKNYPTVKFKDIDLKDNSTLQKLYAHLIDVGVLTPEQAFEALKTNVLPNSESLREAQEEYKKDRDSGLYQPLIGGAKDQNGPDNQAGRPEGAATGPKTVGPIGTGAKASVNENSKFSLSKVKDNMLLAQGLEENVTKTIKDKFNIKRVSKLQKTVIDDTVALIMANEEPAKWLESVASYCDKPVDKNHERVTEVNKVAVAHQLEPYLAGILYASRVEDVKAV